MLSKRLLITASNNPVEMKTLEWKSEHSVGIEIIDSQHKKILALINALNEEEKGKVSAKDFFTILNDLIQYAQEHFTTEETMMKAVGYPQYLEHKQEHDAFVERVFIFNAQLQSSKGELFKEVANFLAEWYDFHILTIDKRYGPYLRQKGAK